MNSVRTKRVYSLLAEMQKLAEHYGIGIDDVINAYSIQLRIDSQMNNRDFERIIKQCTDSAERFFSQQFSKEQPDEDMSRNN